MVNRSAPAIPYAALYSFDNFAAEAHVTVPVADTASSELPLPAEGTHLFALDDEAVLYSHGAQEIYRFNAAAASIWRGIERRARRAELAAALGALLECSEEDARAHIEAALEQYRCIGVLAGHERPALKPPEPTPGSTALGAAVALREASKMSERWYRLLATCVRVRVQSAAQEALVHPIFAHLETSEREAAATVVVTDDGERQFVYIDGELFGSALGLERLAPMVKGALWQAAIRDHRYFLHIHSGVVSDGESLILLPATSGRGKSTLTAGLIHAGFQYFSDEVALLEESTFRAAPVPMSLCTKSAAWDLLAPLFPGLRSLPIHVRPDGKHVRYMPPPRESLPRDLRRSLPVRAIVFPSYEPDGPTSMVPLSKAEAAARLLQQCLAVPLDLDPRRVAALLEWLSGLATYELKIASLAQAVRLVAALPKPER